MVSQVKLLFDKMLRGKKQSYNFEKTNYVAIGRSSLKGKTLIYIL